MATTKEHIAQANHNQDVMNSLLGQASPFWDWVAIIAFYKAVHVVEAVFYEQENPPRKHSTAHKDRGVLLKTRYDDLWRSYWPLLKASKAARYLEYEDRGITRDVGRFSEYMPGDIVRSQLLGGYLVRFETSAARHLPDPIALRRFTPSP